MKTKLAIAATTLIAAFAAGATEYTTTTSLDADVNDDKLTLGNNVTLDLAGHNLTCTQYDFGAGSMITNSIDTTSTFTIDYSGRFGDNDTIATPVFGGNVAVVLNGKGKLKKQFMNAANTHTGGTTLNGLHDMPTENYFDWNQFARLGAPGSFGTGPLTMKNGSRFNYISTNSAEGLAFPWESLIVENDVDNVMTNVIKMERRVTFAGDVEIKEGSSLLLIGHDGKSSEWTSSFAKSFGTLFLRTSGSFSFRLTQGDLSHANVVFMDNESSTFELGLNSSETSWSIGELSTADTTTAPAPNLKIKNLTGTAKNLTVGGKGTNSTFYGDIGGEGSNILRLIKEGMGTLTLGGQNTYNGSTTLNQGTVKLIGNGTLGKTDSTQDIIFNGGTLAYGDGVDAPLFTDYSSRIKSSTGAITIDTGTNTINWASKLAASNVGGITKLGTGTLKLDWQDTLMSPVGVSNGTLHVETLANVTGDVQIVKDSVYALYGDRREIGSNDDGKDQAAISGEGTLRLIATENNEHGWRIWHKVDFSKFTGTLEFARDCALGDTTYGFTGAWKSDDNHLDNTTVLISGAPATPGAILDIEHHLAVGALQVTNEKAQVRLGTHYDTYNITFGTKADSESILNGQFVRKEVDGAQKVNLTKDGNTPLTLGAEFDMASDSTLNVNAGTLIVNADLSGDLNYTLNIASGVTLAGSGRVSAEQFAAAADSTSGKTTYSVKAMDGVALTVAGEVNLSNVTLDIDLEGVNPKATETSYTLLSATGGFTGSPDQSLVASLNAQMTKGKWKLAKVGNDLVLKYSPPGFAIVIR